MKRSGVVGCEEFPTVHCSLHINRGLVFYRKQPADKLNQYFNVMAQWNFRVCTIVPFVSWECSHTVRLFQRDISTSYPGSFTSARYLYKLFMSLVVFLIECFHSWLFAKLSLSVPESGSQVCSAHIYCAYCEHSHHWNVNWTAHAHLVSLPSDYIFEVSKQLSGQFKPGAQGSDVSWNSNQFKYT